jgi:hypothetical protein
MKASDPKPFTLQVGGLELRTLAAAALAAQAGSVLQTVADLVTRPPGIAAGSTVDFSGALFVVASDGDGQVLHVCEPDYGGQGQGQVNRDISGSLLTLVRQLQLIRKVGLEPVPCSVRQTFTAPRALDWSGKIYLQRDAARADLDSGWFIGSAEPDASDPGDDPAAYQVLPIYALFGLRPAAMAALLLPVGCIAVVEGDRIIGVADDQDQELWSADSE